MITIIIQKTSCCCTRKCCAFFSFLVFEKFYIMSIFACENSLLTEVFLFSVVVKEIMVVIVEYSCYKSIHLIYVYTTFNLCIMILLHGQAAKILCYFGFEQVLMSIFLLPVQIKVVFVQVTIWYWFILLSSFIDLLH